MRDFLFLFRMDYAAQPATTPEERQAMTKRWMDWIGGIAAQNRLGEKGNRLDTSGRVVRSQTVVTNGPYAEIKESIGGYSLIKASSYDDAVEIAKGCPILTVGGNVEVRELNPI